MNHKIIEWINENSEYIDDEYTDYLNQCKKVLAKHHILFDNVIKEQARRLFLNKLISTCSYNIGVSYEECNNILEDLYEF